MEVNHAELVRNFYRKQGAEAERERIIKLLENYPAYGDFIETPREHLIALIKGENK